MVLLWNPQNLVLLLESICFCFCLWIPTVSVKFSVKIHQCKKKKTIIKKLWGHDFRLICSGSVPKRVNSRTQTFICDEQSVVFTASDRHVMKTSACVEKEPHGVKENQRSQYCSGKACDMLMLSRNCSHLARLSWCTHRVSQKVFWIQQQKRPDHLDNTKTKHKCHLLTQLVVLFSWIILF